MIDTSGKNNVSGETGNSAILGGAKPKEPKKVSLADKDGNVKFVIKVCPTELEGLASLWKIAQQASEYKVNNLIVELLIKVYTAVDEPLKERLPGFEDLYIKQCREIIHENLDIIEARSDEQKLAI